MFRNIVSNPKTSSLGAVAGLLFVIAGIWAPPQYAGKIQATSVAIATSGLLISRDPQ